MKWYLLAPVALLISFAAHGSPPWNSDRDFISDQFGQKRGISLASHAVQEAAKNFWVDFPYIAEARTHRTPAVGRFLQAVRPILEKPSYGIWAAPLSSASADFFVPLVVREPSSDSTMIGLIMSSDEPCVFPNGQMGPVTVRLDLPGSPICFDLQYIAKDITEENMTAIGNAMFTFGMALKYGLTPDDAHKVARFAGYHLQKRPTYKKIL